MSESRVTTIRYNESEDRLIAHIQRTYSLGKGVDVARLGMLAILMPDVLGPELPISDEGKKAVKEVMRTGITPESLKIALQILANNIVTTQNT